MPETKTQKCAECPWRRKAEENPRALISRLWRWHTSWCPGWKAYERSLAEGERQA